MTISSTLGKLFTFLSGVAASVATIGVAGGEAMGMPKWLVITCIAMTGGFAKMSAPPVTINPPKP